MDNFQVNQGATLTINVTLKDANGIVVDSSYPGGGYSGAEGLSTAGWPGGDRDVSFIAATTWVSAAAGTIRITVSAAQSALLVPGTYELETTLIDAGTPVVCYLATLDVLPAPGGLPLPPTSGAITRLALEIELVDRDAALLKLCGKSTMADGANPALGGPIAFGLQCMGVTPAIPGTVTDADLARLDPSRYFDLAGLAEYRLLHSCLNNFAQPDQSTGNSKVALNTMMLRFTVQMNNLYLQYKSFLSIRRNPTLVGSIRYNHPTPNTQSWGLGNGRYDH